MISYLLTTTFLSIAIAEDLEQSDGNDGSTTNPEATETEKTAAPKAAETKEPVVDVQESTESEEPSEEPSEADTIAPVDDDTSNSDTEEETSAAVEQTDEVESTDEASEQTEIEQMMSEIMQEMAESEGEVDGILTDIAEDSEDDEEFNYKGNLEYSYVMTIWDSPERNIFHVAQFSGDPQYYFRQADDWGYTLGARFQVTGSETLVHQYYHTILGITGGFQYKGFRINTAASWNFEQYFAQSETDRADGFVTYQYNELPQMSGLLWENTLTYSPTDTDFGVQASVGFPFQMSGEREMGNAFTDAWQVGTRLNISFFQLGYTHMVYPGHSIQRVQVGTGILF